MITASYDNNISSFLVPQDLLDDRDDPLPLRPQKTIPLAESTNILASSPYFDVRYPGTDHLLLACRDHPIQLYSALPPFPPSDQGVDAPSQQSIAQYGGDVPLASYRLVSPTTEAYLPVHSVAWPSPGTHFLVGARDLIAQFDITRNGDGPSACVPTIPSRRHIRKGNGIGMRGTVSALSAQATAESAYTGLVAAGTWTRSVGLYDFARGGECVSTWNVAQAASSAVPTDSPPCSSAGPMRRESAEAGIGGAGINQTIWSPCGRYLLINERQSTGLLIYDVRVTNKLLGFLAGRDALTNQRLSCDVFRGLDAVGGFEVWAGTRDTTVKVWEGVGNAEGCQWPSWDFSTSNADVGTGEAAASPATGSVALHHSGSVVATCSGCWVISDDNDDDEVDSETDSSVLSSDQSSDESQDASSDTSSRVSSPSPSSLTGPRSGGRKFVESTLKLWKIGPVTPVDDTGHIHGTEALEMEGLDSS